MQHHAPEGSYNLLDLLADCINRNDPESWRVFMTRVQPLFLRVFTAHAQIADRDEFLDWFPGWFYAGRKLHAAYRACLLDQGDVSCPDPEAAAAFLDNYLARCVRSGVSDFYKERAALPRTVSLEEDAEPAALSPLAGDESEQLRNALDQLPPEIRIPFRLRYYHSIGPLPPVEIDWIAQATGQNPTEVESTVEQQAQQHQELDFPLDASFIGRLLRLSPRANGNYSSIIDQRVRRARDRLRELLS